MSKPLFTVLISLTGEYSIVKREQVPYLDCKGTSKYKCKKITEEVLTNK